MAPADCCNKTGYVNATNATCGCAPGYSGTVADGLCYDNLVGCKLEFAPGYIAAAVLGTVVICAIFFVVCYLKICRSKDHKNKKSRASKSGKKESVSTASVGMTTTTKSADAAQYSSVPANSSGGVVQPFQSDSDGELRKISATATLPRNIQDILPTRYRIEGSQTLTSASRPSATLATPGQNNYAQSASPYGEAAAAPRPPPVDPNSLPIFYGEVQYRAIKLLGQGNFGRAYLVTNEKGRQLVIKTQFCPSREQLVEANKEALVLMQFKSEHLLEITDVFPEGAQELCLVINFCSGGTLADQVTLQNPVEEVVRMIRELSRGLAVLHAKDYIHRDIKPDNIFLADKDSRRVVIGDMGLARQVDSNGYYDSSFGHTLYKAPEIAQSKFSWRSDMWAVGCVLLELLSHTTMMELYSSKRAVLGVMNEANLSALINDLIPHLVGTSAWKLVNSLLVLDSHRRLTAAQVAVWDLGAM